MRGVPKESVRRDMEGLPEDTRTRQCFMVSSPYPQETIGRRQGGIDNCFAADGL